MKLTTWKVLTGDLSPTIQIAYLFSFVLAERFSTRLILLARRSSISRSGNTSKFSILVILLLLRYSSLQPRADLRSGMLVNSLADRCNMRRPLNETKALACTFSMKLEYSASSWMRSDPERQRATKDLLILWRHMPCLRRSLLWVDRPLWVVCSWGQVVDCCLFVFG